MFVCMIRQKNCFRYGNMKRFFFYPTTLNDEYLAYPDNRSHLNVEYGVLTVVFWKLAKYMCLEMAVCMMKVKNCFRFRHRQTE